jgi:hypothetical protein
MSMTALATMLELQDILFKARQITLKIRSNEFILLKNPSSHMLKNLNYCFLDSILM